MKLKLLPVILILLYGFLATSVLAEDGSTSGGIKRFFLGEVRRESPKPSVSPRPTFSPKPEGKDVRRFSLNGEKLRFCQAKEGAVTNRLGSLTKLVVMMEGKFDAIAKRVEDYYTNKIVPGGKTLPNYQALVDDIAAKKALVDSALTKAQSDATGFSCTGDDPKGQLTQYRSDMQAVKKALQDYRSSIKNLIVAIRTLVGGTESPEPTATPV